MHVKKVALLLFLVWALPGFSQNGTISFDGDNQHQLDDVQSFFAETKQVNQFFRRFNAEEDKRGVKFSPRDSLYHDLELRRQYINLLFDEENIGISDLLRKAFVNSVTDPENPVYLNFHGGDWFAEVFAKFKRGKQDVFVTLMMRLVKENLGSKWVIEDVRYGPYQNLYAPDDKTASRFLHPLSHELDFMNLDKVFSDQDHVGDYFKQGFEPCKLSIFLYELNNRYLDFKFVSGVKFHFFQIEGWYFEISEFNRPGTNRGWLISNLIKLEDGQKDSLKNFIYNME